MGKNKGKGQSYLKQVREDNVVVANGRGVLTKAKKPVFAKVAGDMTFVQWSPNLTPIVRKLAGSDFKLLYWIGVHMEFDEGIICLNKVYKLRFIKEMGGSLSAVDKSLAILKKLKVLAAHEDSRKTAIFRVNPSLIWNGYFAERDKKETQWLLRERFENLPDREKQIAKQQSKWEGHSGFDFSKVSPASYEKFTRGGIG